MGCSQILTVGTPGLLVDLNHIGHSVTNELFCPVMLFIIYNLFIIGG